MITYYAMQICTIKSLIKVTPCKTGTCHTETFSMISMYKINHFLNQFYSVLATHLSEGSGDKCLNDCSPVVVQQMDLVNNEQSNQLSKCHITCALAGDNVPLLRSCH